MEQFIDFIVDLADEELYSFFDGNARAFFLHGGCFEFAKIIKSNIKHSKIIINKEENHCGVLYRGKLYDANGLIKDKNNFRLASTQDIKFMEDNFGIPEKRYINGIRIVDFLNNELKFCNIEEMLKKLDDVEQER